MGPDATVAGERDVRPGGPMRILFDLGHPAHYHLFRNAMAALRAGGHHVRIFARHKDCLTDLLDAAGWGYEIVRRPGRSIPAMAAEAAHVLARIVARARRERFDLMVGTSVVVGLASRLTGARSVVFGEDDARAVPLLALAGYRPAHYVVTPQCLAHEDHGPGHLTYPGYHELAYLHPRRFAPDPGVRRLLGVGPDEPYSLVRLVALTAHHDVGQRGLSPEQARRIVRRLRAKGRVFVSREAAGGPDVGAEPLPTPPHRIFDVMAGAEMLVCDSQSMAMEAAVLGVPSIRCNTFVGRLTVLQELEHRYGLTAGYLPGDFPTLLATLDDWLARPDLRGQWQRRREAMLADTLDLTDWMLELFDDLAHNRPPRARKPDLQRGDGQASPGETHRAGSQRPRRPLRIAMLSTATSVHTRRWAGAFADRGHDVHVLSIRAADIPGATVHTVRVGPANSRSPAWTLLSYLRLAASARRRLRRLSPDVVHASYVPTHGAIAALAGVRPWVLSVWGSDVVWYEPGRPPRTRRALVGYALRRADAICATSRFLRDRTAELAPPGTPVHRTPFGVDTDRLRPPAKRRQDEEFRIGYVKSFTPLYGADVLVRAMPAIVAARPDARLVMVGDGPALDDVCRLAETVGVADRVDFPGRVPHERLADWLGTFDVFVNPSVCMESFGVSVLEASACGLPVVATRVGGVPEVCLDGRTGLLVPPGDPAAIAEAVLALAGDPARREAMGRAGRRLVEADYRWADCVDIMLGRLAAVAAGETPGRPA